MLKRIIALLLSIVMVTAVILTASAEGEKKWSEQKMRAEGWIKITQEGGETLGYSKDSGVTIIEADGFAFKDLNRDGELEPYEDWRLSNEERALDLVNRLSVEEMIPLFTHGGWMSFASTIEGVDYDYIMNGGRAGITRSAANTGNTGSAVEWVNALQALCEATGDWGIPATVSVDPCNICYTTDRLSVGSTFDVNVAFELGKAHGKMYRAVGITMVLGPQIDLCTTPILARAEGTYSEDPALTRDIADAYISGLQSTWAEDGTDLGWGEDSVYAITKHYVGAGAAEGGRNDHSDSGKFDVFPGYNFEAHLIPFFDAAFNLKGSVTHTAGIMPNYAISYSRDGSLGELVGGAYSEYKIGLALENGFEGFILTDFGIHQDGSQPFGVEDYTMSERFMLLYKNGIHQIGGSSDLDEAAEGYELLEDEIGEEEALAILRNAAYHFLLTQFQCNLYENPYVELDHAYDTVYNNETDAFSLDIQKKGVIMLKNSDGTIKPADESADKQTVYVPYVFSTGAGAFASSGNTGAAKWEPAMDLKNVSKYYNVVTDSVGDPTGPDGAYTENDVIRASAEELAGCALAIVPMDAPNTSSTLSEDGTWLPASLQYGEYTAVNARRESIAADSQTNVVNDGYYGTKTETVKLNRSYAGNTVGRASNYSDLELLQYVAGAVPESCKVVVLMCTSNPLVWTEVEPLADAILLYYGAAGFNGDWFFDEALLDIVSGKTEPYGLLNMQQPASMDAVEAQKEDVPRDLECYVDADGNVYDFAFGLNWSGVINDERVATYKVEPLEHVESISFRYADE